MENSTHDNIDDVEKTLEKGLMILCFLSFALIGYILTRYMHF